ncbi:MAG: CehA/McbA family metallohydrolase [Pirellulales bacterium]|nr:CehA/McbA family metallohydrolase [Pirellulales bacterium]
MLRSPLLGPLRVLAILLGIAAASCRATETAGATCALHIQLTDAATAQEVPGIVQLRSADGRVVEIAELLNRGQGVEEPGPVHDWWVLPGPRVVTVPAEPLSIAALSGLETEQVVKSIDLTGKHEAALEIALPRIGHLGRDGYLAGNTHLHLRKLSQQQADRYLCEVPRADGLAIVFVSYLERADADLEYTSNKYTPADLARLSSAEVRWGYGQELRHNFGAYGEGYGHVLLLDIPGVIQPVSIGPGITRRGFDSPPLRTGIDEARRLGGKAIWAHNRRGFEDAPNFILGRLDANNVCDGNRHGSYEEPYYQYLNLGLKVPLSTGTDWFLYDWSRAYVMADRAATPTEWLDRLAEGRSFVTNGPLLEFTVENCAPGSRIELDGPRRLKVTGGAVGRADFQRIELVQNGRVVQHADAVSEGAHFLAMLDSTIDVDAPSWLALRVRPPSVDGNPESTVPIGKNEFGGDLFAHTSPIYIDLAGKGPFDEPTARRLIAQMKSDWEQIQAVARFGDRAQRERVGQVYQEAIETLQRRLAER